MDAQGYCRGDGQDEDVAAMPVRPLSHQRRGDDGELRRNANDQRHAWRIDAFQLSLCAAAAIDGQCVLEAAERQ